MLKLRTTVGNATLALTLTAVACSDGTQIIDKQGGMGGANTTGSSTGTASGSGGSPGSTTTTTTTGGPDDASAGTAGRPPTARGTARPAPRCAAGSQNHAAPPARGEGQQANR